MRSALFVAFIISFLVSATYAGPCVYGLCQSACAAGVMTCYGCAGAVFGTIAAAVASPAILGCNAMFGACSSACACTLLLPTP
ncbi:hypothetical protein J3Q64DRAFT_1707808 [Phycomyces blakesleeanus]|uniref:Cysteine-rich protein n=1 Tax=Phycomyces blakesleeanus TaxID=4837 RepID=A0ABR3BC95_PHYBL